MSFSKIERKGRYLRIADRNWENPLDGRFSQRHGGRWNAPGSFPVVYLNKTLEVARANVLRKFQGLPYGPEDLDPSQAPVLVATDVPKAEVVDVVTDRGCRAAGFPETYPLADGETISWERCQPIGQQAWSQGALGIACRSAAPGLGRGDEELAWFERDRALEAVGRQPFESWFWPASA